MSFLAAAGSIAAAEALAAAAMAGTTAAQVAAAAVAAEAAAAAATATAVAIPTAAGIGGAMPTAAALAEGAATGIAPGVAPGGLGALPTVATTVAPVVAEESIKQITKEGVKAAATEGGEGISEAALDKGNKQILLEATGKPVPVEKPLPSNYFGMTADSSGAGGIMTDAQPVNAGTIKPSTPSPSGSNSFSSIDAFNSNAIKNQGSISAQRTAMEDSAKMFADVGGKYEPAITKAPVEQSFLDKAGEFVMNNKMNIALGGLGAMQMMPPSSGVNPISETMIRPYTYSEEDTSDQEADPSGREKIRYSSSYAAGTPYKAAQGGLLSLHRGGNFLSGRGDGMSDDIPAMIGTKQPARLADGEFVIPADVVSHIGNGSSKAGAEKLYAMMDKIRQERTGRKRQSPQINAAKYLPR
jgi:hypothetical protein